MNFYFESYKFNVPIDAILLISILLYIMKFHVMSRMSRNVKIYFWPFYAILDMTYNVMMYSVQQKNRINEDIRLTVLKIKVDTNF